MEKKSKSEKAIKKRFEYCKKIKPDFDKLLIKIAKTVIGKAVIVPLKNPKKALHKIEFEYGGDISKIKDLLRGSIIIQNINKLDNAIYEIQKNFKVIKIKNRFDKPPEDGYRDVLFHIKFKKEICEIQVHLNELINTKEYINHLLYDVKKIIKHQAKKVNREIYPWENRIIRKIVAIEKYSNEQAFIREISKKEGVVTKNLIFFVSKNNLKYKELKEIFPNLKIIHVDLPEIETKSHDDIIKAKLDSALDYVDGIVIVDDIALYCEGLMGLPGPMGMPHPFHRYYNRKVDSKSFAKLIESTNNTKAKMVCTIGLYYKDKAYIFDGIKEGNVVLPRGKNGHEWDSIFQPNGYDKTFGEMNEFEREKISPRSLAAIKLFNFLKKQGIYNE